MKYRVLVLGAYGNFGSRICRGLVGDPLIELIIAGRSLTKAETFCVELADENPVNLPFACAVDMSGNDFQKILREMHPDLVIHTCGPFQGQDYRVAKGCLDFGVSYIDIADGRRFVCDIGELDALAKQRGVLAVSGASTVPGVSSCVIDHLAKQFANIDDVYVALSPGNKSDRGLATVEAILSYTGKSFLQWCEGKWKDGYGWMDSRKIDFGEELLFRHVANVNVPDLELFPPRYNVRGSVAFQAGLELPVLHHAMRLLALTAKYNLIRNWRASGKFALAASNLLSGLGSDNGGMIVQVKGIAQNGESKIATWTLVAENNSGPNVPAASAIILARKMARAEITNTGAMPCMGLFSLNEFEQLVAGWGIKTYENVIS